MTTSRWRRWAGAFALLAGATALAPADAADLPWCQRLAVSPTFATDRTAACYTFRFVASGTEVFVYVTQDGMRNWRRATSAGFTSTPNTRPQQLFFFGRTLFLQTTDCGLLFSDDLGGTFQVADPLGGSPTGRDNLTLAPALIPALPIGFPAVEIAYGDNAQNGAAMIRPPLHQRVVGSTDADVRFAVYTDPAGNRRWLSLAFRQPGPPTPNPNIVAVWDCDATLTCAEKRHEFPKAYPLDILAAPDFGRSGVLFVKTESTVDGRYQLWRSADGGRHFAEVGPVAAFRKDLVARKLPSGVNADVTFLGGRNVLLSLEYFDDVNGSPSLPVRQIFASGDLGATWRLTAYGRSPFQKGPRGTLTWPGGGGRIEAVAGRWFLLGEVGEVVRPFCSRDGGRTWKSFCD